jgi:hypothetical protein
MRALRHFTVKKTPKPRNSTRSPRISAAMGHRRQSGQWHPRLGIFAGQLPHETRRYRQWFGPPRLMAAETATVSNTAPAEIRNASIDCFFQPLRGTIGADANPTGERSEPFHTHGHCCREPLLAGRRHGSDGALADGDTPAPALHSAQDGIVGQAREGVASPIRGDGSEQWRPETPGGVKPAQPKRLPLGQPQLEMATPAPSDGARSRAA